MPYLKLYTSFLTVLVLAGYTFGQEDITKKLIETPPPGTTFSSLLHSGPRPIDGLKIGDRTPNEIEGLRFSETTPLSAIRLGHSDKAAVIKSFGSDCIDRCRLANGWSVRFDYYSQPSGISTAITDHSGTHLFSLVPKPEYIGRVRSIVVTRSQPITVKSSLFRDSFSRNCAQPMADGFQIKGQKPRKIEFQVGYYDAYGLEYTVIDGSNNDNCFSEVKRGLARVQRIRYSVPSYVERAVVFEMIPIPD